MTIMRPLVNMNGTQRGELVQQRRDALDGLRAAMDALAKTLPHGRDYAGDPARFDHDRGVFRTRITALQEMHDEILEEALCIQDGDKADA